MPLFKRQVTFLGHVVSSEGIKTDPSKIKAVSEWPRTRMYAKSVVSLVCVATTGGLSKGLVPLPSRCIDSQYRVENSDGTKTARDLSVS